MVSGDIGGVPGLFQGAHGASSTFHEVLEGPKDVPGMFQVFQGVSKALQGCSNGF